MTVFAKRRPKTSGKLKEMLGWLDGRQEQIRRQQSLRLFGATLACAHALIAVSWAALESASASGAVCWPQLSGCGPVSHGLLRAYLIVALFSGVMWIASSLKHGFGRWAGRLAYAAGITALVLNIAILVHDYRLVDSAELICLS